MTEKADWLKIKNDYINKKDIHNKIMLIPDNTEKLILQKGR